MVFEFATPQNAPSSPEALWARTILPQPTPGQRGFTWAFFLEMVPHQLVPSSRRVLSTVLGHLEPPSFRPLSRLSLDRISIFAASRLPPRRRPQTRYPYPPCRYRSPTVKRRMATRARQRPSSSYVAVLPPPPSSVFVVVLVSTRQLRFARADLLLTALIPGRRLLARHPLQAPLPRRPQGWLRPSPRRLSVSPAPANGSELDSPSSMSPATPSSGTP